MLPEKAIVLQFQSKLETGRILLIISNKTPNYLTLTFDYNITQAIRIFFMVHKYMAKEIPTYINTLQFQIWHASGIIFFHHFTFLKKAFHIA